MSHINGHDHDPAATAKLLATLRATLAVLGGYQVHALACGCFLVARHDFSAHVPDLRSVQAIAERLKGKA